MRLLTLIRRRELAYRLLDEYDVENGREPFDFAEALRRLDAYNRAAGFRYRQGFRVGAEEWRKAVEQCAKDWPA